MAYAMGRKFMELVHQVEDRVVFLILTLFLFPQRLPDLFHIGFGGAAFAFLSGRRGVVRLQTNRKLTENGEIQ